MNSFLLIIFIILKISVSTFRMKNTSKSSNSSISPYLSIKLGLSRNNRRTGRKYFQTLKNGQISYTIFQFKIQQSSQNMQNHASSSKQQQGSQNNPDLIQPKQYLQEPIQITEKAENLKQLKKINQNNKLNSQVYQKDIEKLCYELTPDTCEDGCKKNVEWLNFCGGFIDFEQAWEEDYQMRKLQSQLEQFQFE